MRFPIISLSTVIVICCLGNFSFSQQSSNPNSNTSNDASISKSIAPIFDWSEELIQVDVPDRGYRFADLSDEEVKALRQGFKLTLDALANADSIDELSSLIIIRPLPNPAEPFLPVEPGNQGSSNPFGEKNSEAKLGPLDRLFLAEGRLNTEDGELISEAIDSSDDPFADEDPFGDSSQDNDNQMSSSTEESEDPFASDESEDSDPFGGSDEDDPFAGF